MPSAFIVHQPGAAPPGRTNRIRPSGVHVAEADDPVRGQATHVGPVGPHRVDVLLLPVDRLEQDAGAVRGPFGVRGGERRRAHLVQPVAVGIDHPDRVHPRRDRARRRPSRRPGRRRSGSHPETSREPHSRRTGRAQFRRPDRSRGPSWRPSRGRYRADGLGGVPDEDESRAVAGEGQLRVAQAGSGAAGVHGLGPAAARVGQEQLSFVRVEEARPIGRPDRRGLVGVRHRPAPRGRLPVRSDDAQSRLGHGASPTEQLRPLSTSRMNAIDRPAGCSGSAPASRMPESAGDDDRRRSARGRDHRRHGQDPGTGGQGTADDQGGDGEQREAAPAGQRAQGRRRRHRDRGDALAQADRARPRSTPTSAAYQARSRCSSSRSVIGRSPWSRPYRSRRAAASVRSGGGTGPCLAGCRAGSRCRRR